MRFENRGIPAVDGAGCEDYLCGGVGGEEFGGEERAGDVGYGHAVAEELTVWGDGVSFGLMKRDQRDDTTSRDVEKSSGIIWELCLGRGRDWWG